MRLHMPQQGGAFAAIAHAIADAEAMLRAIDLVRVERDEVVRDVTVASVDSARAEAVVRSRPSFRSTHATTSQWTTPLGRVSMAIHEDPAKAWALTIKNNTVAMVSDGTAILGLGDIGPEAAMPVMEGNAMLFKEFAGVDAFPLCLDTKDVEEKVAFVKAAACASRCSVPRNVPDSRRCATMQLAQAGRESQASDN